MEAASDGMEEKMNSNGNEIPVEEHPDTPAQDTAGGVATNIEEPTTPEQNENAQRVEELPTAEQFDEAAGTLNNLDPVKYERVAFFLRYMSKEKAKVETSTQEN